MEIRWKNLIPRFPPFKVTRGHWNNTDRSATYDFLLVIHSNHEPISYRFQDKRRFRSKIANFLIIVYLTSPLREFPLEFCNGDSIQKLGSCPYQKVERLWRYVHSCRYNTIMWRTYGQTDGIGKTISRSVYTARWWAIKIGWFLLRGKSYFPEIRRRKTALFYTTELPIRLQ